MLISMMLVVTSIEALCGQEAREPAREQIGEVLGQPVFRDEIRTGKGIQLRNELHRLFTVPVLKAYREQHGADIEPTEKELAAATEYFDRAHRERIKQSEPKLRERLADIEQELLRADLKEERRKRLERDHSALEMKLNPPGRPFAAFVLENWKLQTHLYHKYGGGRILWQQAGIEAFDACRTWLEACERNGDFKITDPQLRTAFYEYWTTLDHGAFLTDDKERIREFLEPKWMRGTSTED